MQGTIAQVIALVAHGNGELRGFVSDDASGFYPANSTFRFCEEVRFVTLQAEGARWSELPYAADPVAWIRRIKAEGVTRLQLRYVPSARQKVGDKTVPDYQLVGFVGGGGRWLIEAVKSAVVDVWESRWEVGDKTRKDQKIWRVTYGRTATNQVAPPMETVDLEELRGRFSKHLKKIATFARAQGLDHFALAFERGLTCLSASAPPENLYHHDLVPAGLLPSVAVQLLNAAQAAWVFGAMGSWNDVGFDGGDQTTYEQLSSELYSLLIQAITGATNTAGASTPSKSRAWWHWWK